MLGEFIDRGLGASNERCVPVSIVLLTADGDNLLK